MRSSPPARTPPDGERTGRHLGVFAGGRVEADPEPVQPVGTTPHSRTSAGPGPGTGAPPTPPAPRKRWPIRRFGHEALGRSRVGQRPVVEQQLRPSGRRPNVAGAHPPARRARVPVAVVADEAGERAEVESRRWQTRADLTPAGSKTTVSTLCRSTTTPSSSDRGDHPGGTPLRRTPGRRHVLPRGIAALLRGWCPVPYPDAQRQGAHAALYRPAPFIARPAEPWSTGAVRDQVAGRAGRAEPPPTTTRIRPSPGVPRFLDHHDVLSGRCRRYRRIPIARRTGAMGVPFADPPYSSARSAVAGHQNIE